MTITVSQGNDRNAIDEIVQAINNGEAGGGGGITALESSTSTVTISTNDGGESYDLGVNTANLLLAPSVYPTNETSLTAHINRLNKIVPRAIQFQVTTTPTEFTIPNGFGYFTGCVLELTKGGSDKSLSMRLKKTPSNSAVKKLIRKRFSQVSGEDDLYFNEGSSEISTLQNYVDLGLVARKNSSGSSDGCYSDICLSDVNVVMGSGDGVNIRVFAEDYSGGTIRAHFMVYPVTISLS